MPDGVKKTKKRAKPKPKPKAVPLPTDPLYRFYVSLFRQNPKSEMAITWLLEHGLGHIVLNFDGVKI